jgi:hypothetical protein
MATGDSNFPTSLDTVSIAPIKATLDAIDLDGDSNVNYEHGSLHSVLGKGLIAAETKLGTGATTPTSAAVLVGSGTGTSAWSTAPVFAGANITGIVAPAGTLTGTTLNSSVVTSSLTTVGVLNSGSINTSFGTINTGSSTITTTGAVATGALAVTGDAIHSADGVFGHTAQITDGPSGANGFQILSNTNIGTSILLGQWGAYNHTPHIQFSKSRETTIGDPGGTAVISGDTIMRITGYADDGTDTQSYVGQINMTMEAGGTLNNVPAYMSFLTNGGSAGATERLRIHGNGQVDVKVTTASTSASTGALVVGGGIGVAFDIVGGDDLLLTSSGAAITFNADVSLTHSANHLAMSGGDFSVTGGSKIFFDNGSNTYIYQESDDDLHIVVGGTAYFQIDQDIDAMTIGGASAPNALYALKFDINHATGGASTGGSLFGFLGILTGAGGDTGTLSAMSIIPGVVTQTASENIAVIASLRVDEPNITDNLTGDITDAATIYINSAPTEGEADHALLINTGKLTQRDTTDSTSASTGSITTEGGVGIAKNLYVAGPEITVEQSNSGGNVLMNIKNGATANGSRTRLKIESQPTDNTVVDPSINFDIDGVVSWHVGVDNSNNDRFSFGPSNDPGGTDAIRVTNASPPVITYNTTHHAGTFDYVCDTCGDHRAEPFICHKQDAVWHDDVMDFRAMVVGQETAIDYFCKVGVMERTFNNDGKPEVFTTLDGWRFAGAMAYQTRIRLDSEIGRLETKIDELRNMLPVA